MKLNSIVMIASLLLNFAIVEQSSADQCQAICAPMHRSFSKRNIFSSDTVYYWLDAEPYRVVASSYVGLQRLCPNGYLLTNYDRVYVRPAMMGMGALIDAGTYLKDVVGYSPESCMATVTEPPAQGGQYIQPGAAPAAQ